MASPASSASPAAVSGRRFDLDWLRITAFALLILYHVGMFYVTWDWHVKSSRASESIEPLMRMLNPWRLLLLFVIAGCATRFMLERTRLGAFLGSRTMRLLPPLVFAMLVIVPPQTWFEIVEKLHYTGSVGEFYQRYITMSGGWGMITPTWNHMWFVAYLLVYTLLLPLIAPLLKQIPGARWMLHPAALVLGPWLFLTACRFLLAPLFEETHALIDDWYSHAIYFTGFLFGYCVAKSDGFFAACMRGRLGFLLLALAAWLGLEAWRAFAPPLDEVSSWAVRSGLRQLQAWCAILAAIGYAHRYLAGRDGPMRRYMTDAIFPFYIIHQTVIVAAGFYLNRLGLPLALEAAILITLTLLACAATYEIARRIGVLRPLFGLRMKAGATSSSPAPA